MTLAIAWAAWAGWTLGALGAVALGAWVVGRSGRHLRRCPKCSYDMSATPGMTCPECGRVARAEHRLRRRRRSRHVAIVGACFVGAGVALLVVSPVRHDGWAAVAPDWAIWPLMPWFDERADRLASSYTTVAMNTGRVTYTRWERLLLARSCVRAMERSHELPGTSSGAMTQVGNDQLRLIEGLVGGAGDERRLLLDDMIRLIGVNDFHTSRRAADMIATNFARSGRGVDELRAFIDGAEGNVQANAMRALAAVVVRPEDVVGEYVRLLKSPSASTRRSAVSALGNLREVAVPALPELEALARAGPDGDLKSAAERAISRIKRPTAGPGK